MEYDPGHGDYVAERRELFRDLTLDDAIARARAKSDGGAPYGKRALVLERQAGHVVELRGLEADRGSIPLQR